MRKQRRIDNEKNLYLLFFDWSSNNNGFVFKQSGLRTTKLAAGGTSVFYQVAKDTEYTVGKLHCFSIFLIKNQKESCSLI